VAGCSSTLVHFLNLSGNSQTAYCALVHLVNLSGHFQTSYCAPLEVRDFEVALAQV
jgi:hypothetical protein